MSTTGMVLMVSMIIVVGLVGWMVGSCKRRKERTEAELARLDDQIIQCDHRLSQMAEEIENALKRESE